MVTRTGISRGLTNSPLDCWFRRCGAVALFDSSYGSTKITPQPKLGGLFW